MQDHTTQKLGKLITSDERRDAVHIAVVPVQAAAHPLKPGDHVALSRGRAYRASHDGEGIVDPYLTRWRVFPGEWSDPDRLTHKKPSSPVAAKGETMRTIDTDGFERQVEWSPAYDKRPKNPGDPDYGVHGMELHFILLGPKGDLATQFVLYTNWHLPHVEKELDAKLDSRFPHLSCHPLPSDLGYHSAWPTYEDQSAMGHCDILSCGNCHYDGSGPGLAARDLYERFVAEGEEVVWTELRRRYDHLAQRIGVEP